MFEKFFHLNIKLFILSLTVLVEHRTQFTLEVFRDHERECSACGSLSICVGRVSRRSSWESDLVVFGVRGDVSYGTRWLAAHHHTARRRRVAPLSVHPSSLGLRTWTLSLALQPRSVYPNGTTVQHIVGVEDCTLACISMHLGNVIMLTVRNAILTAGQVNI